MVVFIHTAYDSINCPKPRRQPVPSRPSYDLEALSTPPPSQTPPPADSNIKQSDAKGRGQSTFVTPAPLYWFAQNVQNFIGLAENTLAEPRVHSLLSGTYLPAPYGGLSINTEADVVRSSVLWLLHPVTVALQAKIGHGHVICDSEVHANVNGGGIRCDTLIKVGTEAIFVLEYKNRGHLKPAEFESGRLDLPPRDRYGARNLRALDEFKKTFDQKCTHLRKAMAKSKREQDNTVSALGQNAAIITKQAVTYSDGYRTRYVACFDWVNLMLWHFAGHRPENNQVYPKWAYGTFIQDRSQFRKALLGFILAAYDDCRRPNYCNQPYPDPWEYTRRDIEVAEYMAKLEQQQQQ